jgi:membrane fusion protein (multidrug efflux system)
MNRKLILPIILLVVALGVAFTLASNKAKLNAAKQPVDRSAIAIPVTVMTSAMAPLSASFTVPGTLEPYDHAKVMLNAQGKLASLSVDLGSTVTKGQVIGNLDVAQKQLELEAAQLSMDRLKKDYDRFSELLEGKATSQMTYDDMEFQYENAKVRVDQIRQQIRDAQVIAPVSGTVVAKNVEVGEFVGPNTAVVELVDVTRLKAKVFVSESDAYRVRTSQPVSLTTAIYPNETFPGKVTFVSPRGDANHNYEVEVDLMNSKDFPLKSGTFITATFSDNAEGEALLIPKTALGEGLKNPYIFLVQRTDSTMRATKQEITLGREVGEQIAVVNGLEAGQTVVITGQLNLSEGTLVRITNAN